MTLRVVRRTEGKASTPGERMLERRIARGMSTRDLARAAKVNNSTVSRFENGLNVIFAAAVRMADALGVSLDWLAYGRRTP